MIGGWPPLSQGSLLYQIATAVLYYAAKMAQLPYAAYLVLPYKSGGSKDMDFSFVTANLADCSTVPRFPDKWEKVLLYIIRCCSDGLSRD